MYDGIKLNYLIQDYVKWIDAVNIPFTVYVNVDSAEISTKKRDYTITTYYRAVWETYKLTVSEVFYIGTSKTAYYLTIEGSLHKNHYAGKNYLHFIHDEVKEQINHLCKNLCINPLQVKIWKLEIGVNIVTPFIVMQFLRQTIISYSTNPFNRYPKDKNGFSLGIFCELTQYVVKIYDKGLQNELSQNLMRIEKRFTDMQKLKKVGIKYLSDLLDKEKTFQLLPILLKMWDSVLIYDIEPIEFKTKGRFKKDEINLLTKGQDHKYWERLLKENKNNHNNQRKKFKNLVKKYGNNWQQSVKELIKNEWENLFKIYTYLPKGKTQFTNPNHVKLLIPKNENLHIVAIKIKGNNVLNKFCQWCSKDISHQKGGSKFCRDILVGKVLTHDCRNDFNNLKYKIEKIQSMGVLFDIMPFITPLPIYKQIK